MQTSVKDDSNMPRKLWRQPEMVRKNRSKRTIAVAAGSAVLIAAGVLYSAEYDDPLDPSNELKVGARRVCFLRQGPR